MQVVKEKSMRSQVKEAGPGRRLILERGEGENHFVASVELVRHTPTAALVAILKLDGNKGRDVEYTENERIYAEYSELRIPQNLPAPNV